jgi:geranylgeranyl diphosphate synthase type II
MTDLHQIQAIIARETEALNFPQHPSDLYDPIRYTLALGGKRMRPALVVLACLGVGGKLEDALKPALGVEVFHNFTLLHDDIMDDAPLRRNKATVHAKWNANIAILSGDVMFAEAFRLISEAPANVLKRVIDVFLKAAVEVCEGQQWDMDFELRNDVSIDEYLNMIRMKTAVLLGASLELGALCGGADTETASKLYAFGTNLGIAFQLQDDLLDVYGDPDKFGKRVGGDIVSNKKTYLKLKALQLADKESKKALEHWYASKDFNESEKVNAVRALFDDLNIRFETEQMMDQFYREALQNLDALKFDAGYKNELVYMAAALMQRES